MSVRRIAGGGTVPLARINSGPAGGSGLSLLTPEAGALEATPADACSARLTRPSRPRVAAGGATTTTYVVQRVACSGAPMPAQGAAVLSAPINGEHAAFLRRLVAGERLQVSWSLGWPGVMDASGGNALLLEDGRLTSQVHGTDPFFARHPRTAIGTTATGQLLLVPWTAGSPATASA